MKKAKSKFISLMLIAVMLIHALPASAVTAVSDRTDAQATPPVSVIPNPDYVEPGAIRELESRREENVKHFLLPDNTVQAVVYADAVHRKDADGNWKDISNDLTLAEVRGGRYYATADERLVFAEKFTPNAQLWQLSEKGYSIAMSMAQLQLSGDTAVGGTVTVTNAPQRRSATTWHTVEEARVVDNTASIVYSNVKTNTDLEYIMVGNDIKENIVVKSRSNSYTYQFNITLTGLTATLSEHGSISLTDSVTGQEQYTIPAPYMVDAAGEYSNSVSYTLKQTGKGQYALTVTADSRWINAANRTFPVKIDPTVVQYAYGDTYISSTSPSSNYGSQQTMIISNNTIAFMRFMTPSLPSGYQVSSVTLRVAYFFTDGVTDGTVNVRAYQVQQPWNESTLTWDLANQNTNCGLATSALSSRQFQAASGAYPDSPQWANINITNAFNGWMNGTLANCGIALKYYSGTHPIMAIKTRESGTTYRPFYIVSYTDNRIANGLYSIRNVATNMYLDVQAGGYTQNTRVQQFTQAEPGCERNQLFKITFLQTIGDNYYYTIRSMTNSWMGLSVSLTYPSRNAVLGPVLASDQYNANLGDRMWIITQNGDHFTLRNGDDTQGGYLTGHGASLNEMVNATQDSTSNHCKWDLIPYTGDQIDGAFIINFISELTLGERYDFDAVMYSSQIGVNGPPIFRVYNEDMTVTDKATIDPTVGVLTAYKSGSIVICISYDGIPYCWAYDATIVSRYDHEVKHYYDDAMDIRYEDAAAANISSYQEVCSLILGQLFGLQINSSVQKYESCLDVCKGDLTLEKINQWCGGEGSDCDKTWHQNYDELLEEAADPNGEIGPGTADSVNVVWTGHLFNPSLKLLSNWRQEYNIILALLDIVNNGDVYDIEDPNLRADRIFMLLHEMSHQLGAYDHNCATPRVTNYQANPCSAPGCYRCALGLTEKPQCLMTYVYLDLEARFESGNLDGIYCDWCLGTQDGGIPKYLMDHC